MSTLPHSPTVAHLDIEAGGQMRRLGVFLLILGDTTFVLSMVFTYLYLRSLNTEGEWLASDQPGAVSTEFSWVIGAVAVLSWLAYRWAQDDHREMNVLRAGVLLACVIAGVDLGLQLAQMIGAGFTPRDGAYHSAWMALAGYHVVHLLITLFLGAGIIVRAAKGRFDSDRWHIRLVGYWWTWMAVSAILMTATTSLTTAPG
ncbi:MAG: hypothetical protein ACOH2F_01430 [Cellulomonas sp.]